MYSRDGADTSGVQLSAADEAVLHQKLTERREAQRNRDFGEADRLQQELRAHNASLRLLAPFGAEVSGLDLVARVRSGELQHGKGLAATIESAMARTGVVVFRGQGLLSGDDQVAIR